MNFLVVTTFFPPSPPPSLSQIGRNFFFPPSLPQFFKMTSFGGGGRKRRRRRSCCCSRMANHFLSSPPSPTQISCLLQESGGADTYSVLSLRLACVSACTYSTAGETKVLFQDLKKRRNMKDRHFLGSKKNTSKIVFVSYCSIKKTGRRRRRRRRRRLLLLYFSISIPI